VNLIYILPTFFALFILYSCTNHMRIKTFREGSYTVKATYVDSARNGPTWLYDSLGRLMRVSNFKDGSLNGTTIHYYPNGAVSDSVEYKCDKKYGYLWKYNKDGSLHEISYWYFDLQYGPYLAYQKDNILKTFSFVDFGKNTIAVSYYNTHGNLDSIEPLTLIVFEDTIERDDRPMLRLFAYLPKIPLTHQSYSIGLVGDSKKINKVSDVEGNNFFIDTVLSMPPKGYHYYLGCNLKAYENSKNEFYLVEAKHKN
jgi:hypothetical protein